ncbi:MAG: prephenate dehydratase domain-containing protein [Pyrinomonadaceae bacterium]
MSEIHNTTSKRKPSRVAFQGAHGAFSEEAAIKLLGEDIKLVPCSTFETLFTSIGNGIADLVLAPIENSLVGSIHHVYDLLCETKLVITGEVIIPISHNLIGLPGAKLTEIETVESHPVALAQCKKFFSDHPNLRRVPAEDTAGSIANVVASADRKRAGIASKRAAQIYGGEILLEHLEDDEENYTRFLLLESSDSVNQQPIDADKFSLVIRTAQDGHNIHHENSPRRHGVTRRGH